MCIESATHILKRNISSPIQSTCKKGLLVHQADNRCVCGGGQLVGWLGFGIVSHATNLYCSMTVMHKLLHGSQQIISRII